MEIGHLRHVYYRFKIGCEDHLHFYLEKHDDGWNSVILICSSDNNNWSAGKRNTRTQHNDFFSVFRPLNWIPIYTSSTVYTVSTPWTFFEYSRNFFIFDLFSFIFLRVVNCDGSVTVQVNVNESIDSRLSHEAEWWTPTKWQYNGQ